MPVVPLPQLDGCCARSRLRPESRNRTIVRHSHLRPNLDIGYSFSTTITINMQLHLMSKQHDVKALRYARLRMTVGRHGLLACFDLQ